MTLTDIFSRYIVYREQMRALQARNPDQKISMLSYRDWLDHGHKS